MSFPASSVMIRAGAVVMALGLALTGAAAEDVPEVSFAQEPGGVRIAIAGKPFAVYVYQDDVIPRPYFCDVRAPSGTQVTRNHPPVMGQDIDDHPTYHPGIWLAFGDISGADFWRNTATVRHGGFVHEPKGGPGEGAFTVRNVYLDASGTETCQEVCRYTVLVRPEGYLLACDSEFSSDDRDFAFGDQEEMGLGVRVATPLAVKKGGSIVNSDGLRNESEAWGKQALWCDYSGEIDGRRVGITVIPDPGNFRRSWFHARDYGLLLANPFGRNAFTGGEKSAVAVKRGERFRLRFGVFVYSVRGTNGDVSEAGYRDYLQLAKGVPSILGGARVEGVAETSAEEVEREEGER